MSIGHLYVLSGEVSIQVLCPFLIGLFVLLGLSYIGFLYILEINPLSDVSSANMFSHLMDSLFMLLMVYFAVWKLFSFILSHLFSFSFVSFAQGDKPAKILLREMSEILLCMFSSRIKCCESSLCDLSVWWNFL